MKSKIMIYLRLNKQKMYCTYYYDKPDMPYLEENPKKMRHIHFTTLYLNR
jgi:hypothetical protein